MDIEIRRVDYTNTGDAQILVSLLNAYALDKMGGSKPLNETTKANLATITCQ